MSSIRGALHNATTGARLRAQTVHGLNAQDERSARRNRIEFIGETAGYSKRQIIQRPPRFKAGELDVRAWITDSNGLKAGLRLRIHSNLTASETVAPLA
jgi:hypothetical protein